MNVKERLILFIKSLGITNAEFERVCNLSNGFVNNTNDRMRKSSLKQISDAFPQLNIDWIINGNGEMLLPEEKNPTTINDLIKIVGKLVEQGEVNAEANRANAEAINRLSLNLERLITLIESNGSITIEKAIG